MLKIRLQGTINDMEWFQQIMKRHRKIKVLQMSKPFRNKGNASFKIEIILLLSFKIDGQKLISKFLVEIL